MTRRLFLWLPLAAFLRADSAQDAVTLIASAAENLSAGNVDLFLAVFDPAMPGYEKFRANVLGLVGQADLGCSIEVTGNEGDEVSRAVELDWVLRIDQKTAHPDDPHATARRQMTVKCRVKKSGKNWRVVSFEPPELFAPPA